MGVSPVGSEKPLIMPPGPFGGNMDTRHLKKGSRLFLPVQVPGALFSVGDAHAAQGDGEVCVTGIECPMYAALRFDLHKGRNLPAPQFATHGPLTPRVEAAGWYATMGVNPDLMQAAKDSLRAMVEHISTTYHMEPVEAYVLASLVVDLKISEIVDRPNWIVSSYLPLSIFR
jgi:acetamidase/formamidase